MRVAVSVAVLFRRGEGAHGEEKLDSWVLHCVWGAHGDDVGADSAVHMGRHDVCERKAKDDADCNLCAVFNSTTLVDDEHVDE